MLYLFTVKKNVNNKFVVVALCLYYTSVFGENE